MSTRTIRALIADDALPAETMHVSASDGNVTLSGTVEFPSQRDEAEDIVNQAAPDLLAEFDQKGQKRRFGRKAKQKKNKNKKKGK